MKLSHALLAWVAVLVTVAQGAENEAATKPAAYAARGYELLSTKAYLPADFDQQAFDELWRTWEQPLRAQAAEATPEERRKMAFARYGLTSAPGDTSGKPQQYVVDAQGNWTMSCLLCHQGQVAGRVIPGAPNSLIALQTLTEDVRITKLRQRKPLTQMDLGSALVPLGTTNGTTNAVIFGVLLMSSRDADLNVLPDRLPGKFVNHDHDAPAWWLFRKKQRIYSDGFVQKDHRPLMQFILVPENGPQKFHEWEADFREIYTWLESLEPPAYPFEIDRPLAARGQVAYNRVCAECHGTERDYPNRIVPIADLKTDPLRLTALTPENREGYSKSWFGHYGEHETIKDPGGYLAPPLDGVWASAPYLHNGSVPTLWHVLHPAQRPAVWTRTAEGYDRQRVGVEFTALEAMPKEIRISAERRRYFDTSQPGKSAGGHLFPDQLTEDEKSAVLEYLKTL